MVNQEMTGYYAFFENKDSANNEIHIHEYNSTTKNYKAKPICGDNVSDGGSPLKINTTYKPCLSYDCNTIQGYNLSDCDNHDKKPKDRIKFNRIQIPVIAASLIQKNNVCAKCVARFYTTTY